MNKLAKNIEFIILFCIFMIFLASFVFAVPGTWKGFVTVNGNYSPKGTIVDLYLNNLYKSSVETGQVETAEDYYYIVTVEGLTGDNISFKINNIDASEGTQIWSVGNHDLNLTINDTLYPEIIVTSPSGTVTTSTVTINVTTNEIAHCRFDNNDRVYQDMSKNMTSDSTGKKHNATVGPLNDSNYAYYIRCNDSFSNVMKVSAVIAFILDTTGNFNYTQTLGKGWNTFWIPDTSILSSMGYNTSDRTNILNISNFLSKTGGLEDNYNVVYYNINGTPSGWKTFMRSDWHLSDLQWINQTNERPYWINMSISDRFEI